MRQVLAVGMFFLALPLEAFVVKEIDGRIPVVCEFSRSDLNRIWVKEEPIKKVIYPEEFFQITLEKTSGQAFVNSKSTFRGKKTLSVITGSGLVQDVEISFGEKGSEALQLVSPDSCLKKRESSRPFIPLPTLEKQIEATLHSLKKGEAPEGYAKKGPGAAGELSPFQHGVKISRIDAFEGPFELVSLYELHNTRPRGIRVIESSIRLSEGSWMYLDKRELKPNAKTLLVIGERKEDA